MSETKLKRGFKNCFGCTVYEYMVEKRMELAHSLLSSGKYKVKDVVWMAGYSNAGHFIKMFRKRYGLTPGEIS
ncbi:helix-turn-helix domain-containing protein [Cloacibacillus evryensis]|nr:AraC family transcriptional regulator [Cloacibacillus evryensis]